MLWKNNTCISSLPFWVLSWPQTEALQSNSRVSAGCPLLHMAGNPKFSWDLTPCSSSRCFPSPLRLVLVLLLIWDLGLLKLSWHLCSIQDAEGDWELICLKLSFTLWVWSSFTVERKLPLPGKTFPVSPGMEPTQSRYKRKEFLKAVSLTSARGSVPLGGGICCVPRGTARLPPPVSALAVL